MTAEEALVVEAARKWIVLHEALWTSDHECLEYGLTDKRYATNVACAKAEWIARDQLLWASAFLDVAKYKPWLRVS